MALRWANIDRKDKNPAMARERRGEFPTSRREISGVKIRMQTGEPCANAKYLHHRPKAGHQDSYNTCVGVAPDEGGHAVIADEVNPEAGPPRGSGAIIEKGGHRQQLHPVNQRSHAEDIRPNSGAPSRAGCMKYMGGGPDSRETTKRRA